MAADGLTAAAVVGAATGAGDPFEQAVSASGRASSSAVRRKCGTVGLLGVGVNPGSVAN
ncbi:hypothetical protein GCM10009687_00850 [Asanoa iriomotensis]